MKTIVNASQAKRIDESIQSTYGISSMLLMERAALVMFDFLRQEGRLGCGYQFGILCGSGNNGGDGLALARLLCMDGEKVSVFLACDKKQFSDSALRQYSMLKKLDVFFTAFIDELAPCQVLVDALFGVGLSRDITGNLADLIDRFNEFAGYKLAVDMPSGIDASTGRLMGAAVKCDATITFGYQKCGQLIYPGRDYCGRVICENIGLTMDLLKGENPEYFLMEEDDIKDLSNRRPADSNKGTFGKVLLIAGSRGMSGAAYFAAKAALFCGCGMVRILTCESNRGILASLLPEAILTSYDDCPEEKVLKQCLDWADLVVFGPGVGQSDTSRQLLSFLFAHSHLPIVIDADGLNLLAENTDRINSYDGEVILTPHMAEMSRLSGISIADLKNDRLEICRDFCREHDVTLVLKDSSTVIASPYKPLRVSTSGNSGLATAGSGDVLCGMIAGLLAATRRSDAVSRAVYLHGKCAEYYNRTRNTASLTASDIIEALPYCY